MNEEQHGFLRNKSRMVAIFILKQIIEKSNEYNTRAFFCFIDLTEAFDRVQLKDVLNILDKKMYPKNILN